MCSPEFTEPHAAAVQHFLLFEGCCGFIERSHMADIVLVSQTVPQDVPEGLESSLQTISHGLLASLLHALSLGPHALAGPVTHVLMVGSVLQLHPDCGRGAHIVLALQ